VPRQATFARRRQPQPSSTPTGMAVFPKDVSLTIRQFAEATNNTTFRSGNFP
jgi:hypothetical protein